MSDIRIVTTGDRPDLIPCVAGWLWHEWARDRDRTVEQVIARLAARRSKVGTEQTFVVLEDGVPVATASLVDHDLDPRPDLTPWLASVYVDPPARGRGHAVRLVRAVEAAAWASGAHRLWLHSEHAAGLYAGLGWVADGTALDHGHVVTLMHRDAPPRDAPPRDAPPRDAPQRDGQAATTAAAPPACRGTGGDGNLIPT